MRAQSANNGYIITGVLKGLGNGKILLGNKPHGYTYGFKVLYFDSCFAHNDSFVLKGYVKEPDFYSIEVAGSKPWVSFILGNYNITIEGTSDSIWQAKVYGSKEDDLYFDYFRTVYNPYHDTFDVYQKGLAEATGRDDSNSRKLFVGSLRLNKASFEQAVFAFINNNFVFVCVIGQTLFSNS